MGADPPPLRYLDADDVRAAMPSVDERLELAEWTMTALATPGASELPPKIGVHPRPEGSFAHAMPAHLRGADAGADLLGMKWVAGFGGNRALGLPAIHALVVLNDAATGVPVAILDGGPITADRTAAVSGVAIARFAPPGRHGGGARIGLIGAGVQGHSHMPVIARLLPGADLRIADRHPDRAEQLAEAARSHGIPRVRTVGEPRDAVRDADVVITAASFTSPDRRGAMTPDWLTDHALVVAVDYATICSAAVAHAAAAFLVDEREQFLANRAAGQFDGYPEPSATLGEAILTGLPRPEGRVLVTHLGVGLADVVFAAAIVRRATEAGLGRVLERATTSAAAEQGRR